MKKGLIEKYRKNSLSLDELYESRALVDGDPDRLAEMVLADWMEANPDSFPAEEELERILFGEILGSIMRRKYGWRHRLWRSIRVVAVVLVPILMAGVVYLWVNRQQPGSAHAAVFTQRNEKARIVLPDNSVVVMNGESALSYDASLMGVERRVEFEGEGYFDIARKDGAPFMIHTQGVTVTVKGTKFNLAVDKENGHSALSLLEGDVSVSMEWGSREIEVEAGERIKVDNHKRCYTIEPIAVNDNDLAWKDGKLRFQDAPLADVVTQLERAYGCHIDVRQSSGDERFTGVLPLGNREASFLILEKAFGCTLRLQ